MRMTAAEMARVSAAVASILAGSSEFQSVVQEVRASAISTGYCRPTTSKFQQVQERQGKPEVPGSDAAMVAIREEIELHIVQAQALDHPLARLSAQVQPDVVAAVQWLHSLGYNGPRIKAARVQMTAMMASWKRRLSGVDAQLAAVQTAPARRVQQPGCSMATIAALTRGLGLPDLEFVAHQCSGFPCIGDYPDSGLFRECERPATKEFTTMHHSVHRESVERILNRQARDPAQRHTLERVTAKKYEEVAKGVARGPFSSPSEVDKHMAAGTWRPLHCFGVVQGVESDGTPKVRPCDNAGKSAGTNDCLSTHETIACEDASFPVLASHVYESMPGGCPPLHHATDDVELAYRRMCAAHPEATVVMIWDTRRGAVSYFLMDGHNFGLASAVLSFNRHSQLVARIVRRMFGVPCAAYFDDYDSVDPVSAGRSGKAALHFVHVLLGVPLAGGVKDVAFAPANAFLGVITDLSRVTEGTAVMRSKPSRIAKLIVSMSDMLSCGRAHRSSMESIVGKLEYTSTSATSGRVGRAGLAVLREWIRDTRTERVAATASEAAHTGLPITRVVQLTLEFFVTVLPLLRPRVFDIRAAAPRRPIVVYTDARYSPNASEPAQIGCAIFDPTDDEAGGRPFWRHSSFVVPPEMMARFSDRTQYVTQLEVLAGVAVYTSRPAQFRGRDVIHFIDNTGAMFGLAKGYSREVDCARLAHVFQSVVCALDANVWVEYVASKANISDLPSRGEYALLRDRYGSVWFDSQVPDVGGDWLAVYRRVFGELAPRPTPGVKRQRAEIAEHVREIRARRVE